MAGFGPFSSDPVRIAVAGETLLIILDNRLKLAD
jgi:hypothetical protein